MRRGLLGSLALVGATLLWPVSAEGLDIQATPPPPVDTGGPTVIPYTVTFSAGASEERFRVIVSAPRSIEGAYTMLSVGSPIVNGSGLVSVFLSAPGPPSFGCSRIPGQTTRGYPISSVTADVDLAAGDQVTITFPFRTGDLPLRPGDSLSPTMYFPFAVGEGVPLNPAFWPAPARSGPVGVSFNLRTKPGGPAAHFAELPPGPPFSEGILVQNALKRIKQRVPIDILGNTSPALIRQKIDLIYTAPRRPEPAKLARVKTDGKGRFRLLDWRPKRLGPYEISATYHSVLPEIRSDYAACSKLISIVRPK